MSCIPPKPGFLAGLRAVCDDYSSVLIFDEVMTGFRVALGGAQALYEVPPDLTTLGKIIGGGLPVGAFGGKRDIMQQIAPLGPVYQAGTLSGNPIAMAAGLETLNLLQAADFYPQLTEKTAYLMRGLQVAADQIGIPFTYNQVGGMFGLFFTEANRVDDFDGVMACRPAHFKTFFHAMLAQHIYLAPSAFEAGFVSAEHTQDELDMTIQAATQAFTQLQGQ